MSYLVSIISSAYDPVPVKSFDSFEDVEAYLGSQGAERVVFDLSDSAWLAVTEVVHTPSGEGGDILTNRDVEEFGVQVVLDTETVGSLARQSAILR